ncbi:MAG TPA: hypothetical protein VFL91_19515 [Thermomicrobiales bacterium]|nr:hypothetical protein [Thermomicrobiales bacterium]
MAREDGRARRPLSPPWRKLLVSLHIIVSVGLLGADAAVLLLCVAGARGADPSMIYPAAHLIGGNLLVPLALLAVATGLALGLFTPWGLVRYWWVAIKLALTVAGTVLALLVLVPTLGTAATAAATGAPLSSAYRLGLVRDTTAASTVLIMTVLLAVYKPFGRLRGRAR